MLLAEIARHRDAPAAEHGLEAPGPVIHARVHYAAVVAALVRCDAAFLLEHGDSDAWEPDGQLSGDRQADDAGSDDANGFQRRHDASLVELTSIRKRPRWAK